MFGECGGVEDYEIIVRVDFFEELEGVFGEGLMAGFAWKVHGDIFIGQGYGFG